MTTKTRAATLSDLLTYAFDALFDISDAPNRIEGLSSDALRLAEGARAACDHITRNDPDQQHKP